MDEFEPLSKITQSSFACTLPFPCFISLQQKKLFFFAAMASPAELVIVPANTTATEGNTLILVCVGYGEPSPEVVWLKDGMELANDSRVTVFTELVVEQGVEFVQTTLEICSLNVTEDSGVYYCNASNDFGSAMSAFDITVQPAGECA